MAPDTDLFQDFVEGFELLDDWEERYRYLIDIGQDMYGIEDSDRVPANKVEGCVSQVWIVFRVETDADGKRRLYFRGDSDAHITRGLIAVLQMLYSGRTLAEVAEINPSSELSKIDLAVHISPQRSNGLRAMVQRIQRIAAEA